MLLAQNAIAVAGGQAHSLGPRLVVCPAGCVRACAFMKGGRNHVRLEQRTKDRDGAPAGCRGVTPRVGGVSLRATGLAQIAEIAQTSKTSMKWASVRGRLSPRTFAQIAEISLRSAGQPINMWGTHSGLLENAITEITEKGLESARPHNVLRVSPLPTARRFARTDVNSIPGGSTSAQTQLSQKRLPKLPNYLNSRGHYPLCRAPQRHRFSRGSFKDAVHVGVHPLGETAEIRTESVVANALVWRASRRTCANSQVRENQSVDPADSKHGSSPKLSAATSGIRPLATAPCPPGHGQPQHARSQRQQGPRKSCKSREFKNIDEMDTGSTSRCPGAIRANRGNQSSPEQRAMALVNHPRREDSRRSPSPRRHAPVISGPPLRRAHGDLLSMPSSTSAEAGRNERRLLEISENRRAPHSAIETTKGPPGSVVGNVAVWATSENRKSATHWRVPCARRQNLAPPAIRSWPRESRKSCKSQKAR